MQHDVVIIGAGLAGLSAAYHLEQQGQSALILERSSSVGGRVKTDEEGGFLFDHGFQVLLDSYEQLPLHFDMPKLRLARYTSGAMVRQEGQWVEFKNPLRSLTISHLGDYLRLARTLVQRAPDCSSDSWLRHIGVTDAMREGFLRPFLGGVFLETQLRTHAERLKQLMWYFVRGHATLPSQGMQALPQQLQSQLKTSEIRFNTEVAQLSDSAATLSSGETIPFKRLIVACAEPAAARLVPALQKRGSRSVSCLYFSLPTDVYAFKPTLYLDGSPDTPILNLSCNSAVQSTYAPRGQQLLSASVVEERWQQDPELIERATEQLEEQFGCKGFKFLRRYTIQHALPDQSRPPETSDLDQLTLAGESGHWASINDALAAGAEAAQACQYP